MREVTLKLGDIRIPEDRARPTDPDEIPLLAEDIWRVGLLHRLTVRMNKDLIDGLHRFYALNLNYSRYGRYSEHAEGDGVPCLMLDWGESEEDLVPFEGGMRTLGWAKSRLVEINANLRRVEPDQWTKMRNVAEAEDILQTLGMRKPRHRPRKTAPEDEEKVADSATLISAGDLADSFGMSRRVCRDWLYVHGQVHRALRGAIGRSKIADNFEEIRRFSRIGRGDTDAVKGNAQCAILMALAGDHAESVREARGLLEGVVLERELDGYDPPVPQRGYRTIVVDPPWDPEISGCVNPHGKMAPTYPTMKLDQIKALEVPEQAHPEGCLLYLWCTGGTVPYAKEIVEGWGFRYIQLLVWKKDRPGTGRYYRNETEFVAFAVKGSARLKTNDHTNHFGGSAEWRHSAKPDAFYEMVRKNSPGPRLDMFARKEHEGFDSTGVEAPLRLIEGGTA